MTERFRRLRAAFEAAKAEADPAARERLVVAACGDDAELLRDLRAVLAAAPGADFLMPLTTDEPVAEPARRLGEFELLHDLSDGRGVVWLASQPSLGRQVAIKVLHAGAATPPSMIERFHREPFAVARLNHPHIVPVYAEGRDGPTHWFAMQFVDGHGLDRELRLQQAGRPNTGKPLLPAYGTGAWFAAAARICAEAADALQAAHEKGIVHRDIKPANLLLDQRGRVLVADFGIARDENLGSLTEPGVIAGTWHYMSPEQARVASTHVDHRTDVYSLGVVLYELLTRARPFEGRTSQEVLENIRKLEPRPIRRHNPNVPRDLETICAAAMSRDPASRYATAADLRDDLRRFLDHEAIRRQPPTLASRALRSLHTNRRGLLVGAALAMALVIGGAVQAHRTEQQGHARSLDLCRQLQASGDLATVPTEQLALARHRLQELAAPPEAQPVLALLERHRADLQREAAELLRPLPPAGPDERIRRREGLVRGLTLLWRLRTVYGDDATAGLTVPTDPFVATVDVSVTDERGEPSTVEVDAVPLDPWTGQPGAARPLGTAPIRGARLPEGEYRLVVRARDGEQRSFTRTLESMALHTLQLTLRGIDDPFAGMVQLPGGVLHVPAGAPLGLAGKAVDVAPFWLDRHEVSVGEYRAFLTATGETPPYGWEQLQPGVHDRLPVVNVTWDAARNYAEWAGKRLPSHAEWMIAARGPGPRPRRYPWLADGVFGNCLAVDDYGTTHPSRFAAYLRHARPVDHDPRSCSPEGIFELFGNVEEWTESTGVDFARQGAVPRPDKRVVVGLAWFGLAADPTADLDRPTLADAGPKHIHSRRGFRCARSNSR